MSEPKQDTFPHRENDLHALSEAQLRQLYEEEEVKRFMSLFSAYVTEVRLTTCGASTIPVEPQTAETATGATSVSLPADRSLPAYIAYNHLLPHLPPPASARFTFKRFSLTTQRLYLALFPLYKVFLLDLLHLALWKDYQRSLRHCVTFWFLWFHDLLVPALVFRITFGLVRRLSPRGALKELQERREETAQALKFGEAVEQYLSATTLGPSELWSLFKLYKAEEKSKGNAVPRDAIETDEENFKRDVLHALNGLADLQERIKNIFAWRRPDVSRRYMYALIVIGFGTLVIPSYYIAKLILWFWGVLFWHVIPIVGALPRGERTRVLRLLFKDAPTDADFAMELIAKRIAAGQDIGTIRSQPGRHASDVSTSTPASRGGIRHVREAWSSVDDGINWKKWGERVALGKSLLQEGRQFLNTHASHAPLNPGPEETSRSGAEGEHTFLAQYASSPGLITLTPSTLFFTSLIETRPRVVIRRDRLRGVRRSGLMKGVSITWAPEGSTEGEEREETFHWVGDRDELFARLVGSDGGRWMTV